LKKQKVPCTVKEEKLCYKTFPIIFFGIIFYTIIRERKNMDRNSKYDPFEDYNCDLSIDYDDDWEEKTLIALQYKEQELEELEKAQYWFEDLDDSELIKYDLDTEDHGNYNSDYEDIDDIEFIDFNNYHDS
jgi:hypothetical protein